MEDPSSPFAGMAYFYARYRPGYPAAVFDRLVTAASLGPDSKVLDLGCGTGQVALEIATRVDGGMLEESARLAAGVGLQNVEFM